MSERIDWQEKYHQTRASAEEALALIYERDVAIIILVSGWHPFEGEGLELHDQILEDLRAGLITPPITQELVWRLAEASGYLPDFKPIFRLPEETIR